MKNPLKVSIGIPVFNEQHNIGKLLVNLLGQNQAGYQIEEILIFDDGSTDESVKIIKSFKSKLIKLKTDTQRLGQQTRQNQILKTYVGDVLVIIEGDTLLYNKNTLGYLVKPFANKQIGDLGMVVGVDHPVKPATFFETIIYNTNQIKQDIFNNINGGINIYTTGGHCARAFSKSFTKKLTWPKDAPEDAYAYLRLKELGLEVKKQKKANIYMRNVTHLKDRAKQSAKYVSGKNILGKYFSQDFINDQYQIPKSIVAKCLIKYFIASPFWTFATILEQGVNKIATLKENKTQAITNVYTSTKSL